MRRGLGDATVEALFKAYDGRVPPEADLVCYWFAKAWEAIEASRVKRVGFVATNSIRGGANRKVLEPIAEAGAIFEAWSDEPWTIDGAAVRVSLVCFGDLAEGAKLDGKAVESIPPNLSGASSNLPTALTLKENAGVAFMGITKSGPFDIDAKLARSMLSAPLNPNGRPNSDVLAPSINGREITGRPSDRWLLFFRAIESEEGCALYEEPYRLAKEKIFPFRSASRTASNTKYWWRYERPRPEMYKVFGDSRRYIATSMVAKHRCFLFVDSRVVPENLIIAIARDDDTTFGILHSRFHEAWSLRLGTWLGVGNDPRYTPTTTFETFPFPQDLTPNIPAADYAGDPRAIRIAEAAKRLDELRRAWLNPPDLVDVVPEVTPTAAPGEAPRRYPDRIVPKSVQAAAKLKERTLTNLYNRRPRWLADAHDALDRAVAAAYGWPEDISTDDALARLLALNLERAKAQ